MTDLPYVRFQNSVVEFENCVAVQHNNHSIEREAKGRMIHSAILMLNELGLEINGNVYDVLLNLYDID